MATARSIQHLRRALRVAHLLAQQGQRGMHVADLLRETGSSRATVYRHLDELRAAGLHVEAWEVEGQRRIRLALDARRLALGPDLREQLALKLLRKALPTLEDSFVAEALDSLLCASNGDLKPQARSVRKAGPAAATLDTIARAIRNKKRLTFRYQGNDDGAQSERVVDPIELRLVRDQLYLIAYDLERNAPRTFKPLRMSAAFVSPEAAKKHKIDVDALLAKSVRIWDAAPVDVVVRLAKSKARFSSPSGLCTQRSAWSRKRTAARSCMRRCLSLFFKRHREDYYRRLNKVRVDGDWEGWLDFFLEEIATIANEAVASSRELFALVAADRTRVLAHEGMSVVALRLFELLPRHPIVTTASVMKLVATTKPTAGRAIELLVAAGVLVETTGKKRDRSFVYRAYLDRLRVGTEPEGVGRAGG